jgi:hypothetical protein
MVGTVIDLVGVLGLVVVQMPQCCKLLEDRILLLHVVELVSPSWGNGLHLVGQLCQTWWLFIMPQLHLLLVHAQLLGLCPPVSLQGLLLL